MFNQIRENHLPILHSKRVIFLPDYISYKWNLEIALLLQQKW